jgi:hypothetical protein
MKIADVRTFIVNNVPPYRGGRRWLFVKLVTDDGLEGIGEWSKAHTGREEAQSKLVEALAREFVVGASPFDIELLWQRMYATNHDFRHPGLDTTPAISRGNLGRPRESGSDRGQVGCRGEWRLQAGFIAASCATQCEHSSDQGRPRGRPW